MAEEVGIVMSLYDRVSPTLKAIAGNTEVNGNIMTIIEGNKGQKVAARSMFVNGRYIRGYCLPDYQSKVEGTNLTAEDVRTIVREEWAAQEAKRNNAAASGWAVEYIQRALQAGILAGVDDGQGGKTIARPQGISTREEMATMGVAILETVKTRLEQAESGVQKV